VRVMLTELPARIVVGRSKCEQPTSNNKAGQMPGGLPGLSDGQAPETKRQKAEKHTGRPAPLYVPLPGFWAASMAEGGSLRLRLSRKSDDLLQVVLRLLESVFFCYLLSFSLLAVRKSFCHSLVNVLDYQSPDSQEREDDTMTTDLIAALAEAVAAKLQPKSPRKLYDLKAAMPPRSVYKLIRNGKIPRVKLSEEARRVLIDVADLDRIIDRAKELAL
jgi:hypothetical protein